MEVIHIFEIAQVVLNLAMHHQMLFVHYYPLLHFFKEI